MATRNTSGVVLGMSFGFHDAAAALVVDGRVVAAAEEERFTRNKHEPEIPTRAVEWCLDAAGLTRNGLDAVAYYEKPLASVDRILSTHARTGPRGLRSLASASASWARRKLWVGYRMERLLNDLGFCMPELTYCDHHLSHAAAAFYPSPFERSAVITLDAVGEWATSSIAVGQSENLRMLVEQRFPDSLGLFYSAMTAYLGFRVNDGEYKLMGLAPYGEPRFTEVLLDRVVEVRDEGSVRLNQRWFDYRSGRAMTRPRLAELLGGPPRNSQEPFTQRDADLACSAQQILELAVLRTARYAHELTGASDVCLAGGVALNCVSNARVRDSGPFERVWVQPAAGDSGSALGAALWTVHEKLGLSRVVSEPDGMAGAALGPRYSNDEVSSWLGTTGVPATPVDDAGELCAVVARRLSEGALVGWFRGPMEFGPRALGHRSILADPRDPSNVGRLNRLVKKREGFRPFAPAVAAEHASSWFDIDEPSPYMSFTAQVRPQRVHHLPGVDEAPPEERLALVRSDIPACTHVDGSARVQTVEESTNPVFHALLAEFDRLTGVPVLLNTSFNGRDEPIVRTPADALRCALGSGLDLLVIEDRVVDLAAAAKAVHPC